MKFLLPLLPLLLILPASAKPDAGKPTVAPPAHPHAAYPKPFSRPPMQGPDYDTWADAQGPDIGELKPDPKRLPPRVDNSTRPQFPPIYSQGNHNACGQYASVASIFTYEQNVLAGTTADSAATRFSPYFSWNMMNKADNNGSEAYHGWECAKRLGIPTAKSCGGVRQEKIGAWPDGYAIWREAMEYRVRGYRYSPAANVEQLEEAKGWLFDRNQPGRIGGLLAMDGRMGKPPERTFTIAAGEPGEGKMIWSRWNPTGFGHGLTCVGYDDQVGYDVNGDGRITNDVDTNGDGEVTLADWERGAYIVVNSWGEKWSADGRIYLLYSAMIDPDWERGNYLGRVEVSRHVPRATLRLTLSCSERSKLRTQIGIAGDGSSARAEHEVEPQVLNGWPIFAKQHHPGAVPIAGPGNDKPIELGVEISELLDKLGADEDGKARLFLRMGRSKDSKAVGKLHACALRLYDAKGGLIRETPLAIGDGSFGDKELTISAEVPLR